MAGFITKETCPLFHIPHPHPVWGAPLGRERRAEGHGHEGRASDILLVPSCGLPGSWEDEEGWGWSWRNKLSVHPWGFLVGPAVRSMGMEEAAHQGPAPVLKA